MSNFYFKKVEIQIFHGFRPGAFTVSYNIVSCLLKRYSFWECSGRSSLIDTLMALKIMTTTMAMNYPRSGEIFPLTDIDLLLRYNIGWQPQEKLLLHSKNIFEDFHSVM